LGGHDPPVDNLNVAYVPLFSITPIPEYAVNVLPLPATRIQPVGELENDSEYKIEA
jgi:hypothetical protein